MVHSLKLTSGAISGFRVPLGTILKRSRLSTSLGLAVKSALLVFANLYTVQSLIFARYDELTNGTESISVERLG